jgi:PmbA protein
MEHQELLENAVRSCQKRGAEHTDALLLRQEEKAISIFDQQVQLSGTSETVRAVLRIFRDHRGAVIVSHTPTESSLNSLVEQGFNLLGQTSPDKYLGPAESGQAASNTAASLQIFDEQLARLSLEGIERLALEAEQAVRQKDSRTEHLITTNLQVQTQTVSLCTSRGFSDSYRQTTATLTVSAVAENYVFAAEATAPDERKGNLMGAATVVTRSLADLNLMRAAERAVLGLTAMSGTRPAPGGMVPVLFAPTAARSITSLLLQLCSGPATLFIEAATLGKPGETICSPLLTLMDDATREKGIGSVPFDHEGVQPTRKMVIEAGVLKDYLLNSYYARALQKRSTGNAFASGDARYGVRPSNAFIEAGQSDPSDLVAGLKRGLLVTKFLSHSMVLASNFTQAVEGYWIEGGKIAHPVRAAAIVAPLHEMLKNIVAVGNDLDRSTAVASPTLLVSQMNVSSLM